MVSLELHIFTNCTGIAPSTSAIRRTYKSFCDVFGKIIPNIWCDPKPNVRNYSKYRRNLLKNFPVVHETVSLSDGYIKAIKSSKADFLFILEHDWQFQKKHINHTLKDILLAMKLFGIYHFRFNKRTNKIKGWDKILDPIKFKDLDMCMTNILSNNPHIVNREKYLSFIDGGLIQVKPGSDGIEEIISKHPKTWGVIYGPPGHPATVKHLDGRKARKK